MTKHELKDYCTKLLWDCDYFGLGQVRIGNYLINGWIGFAFDVLVFDDQNNIIDGFTSECIATNFRYNGNTFYYHLTGDSKYESEPVVLELGKLKK